MTKVKALLGEEQNTICSDEETWDEQYAQQRPATRAPLFRLPLL
jgi:hypothetical protein